MSIQPIKRTIEDIFRVSRPYYIDFYQRDYKWGKEHIDKLLEDLFYRFELEYNENVIYEDDIPKYYLGFSEDLKSAYEVGDWIMDALEKNRHDLSELIIELGNSLNLKWDISSSNVGKLLNSLF